MKNDTATILIVDDMASNIALLYELLEGEYKVKVAKSGVEALEIIQKTPKVDLVLLDIEMPGMDGYEVCKILKNNPETNAIPIIFVTSRSEVEDEEYGFNLGAVDYISKPFHPTIIKIRVKNHINLKLKSDMLEELSMYDGLTHIPNRRYFDEHYTRMYKEALREGTSIGVMMMDVDYFKLYNDNYGHGKGDECLVKIASVLTTTLKRPSDFVARYGGEEFVIVLANTTVEGIYTIAQELLENIIALQIPHQFSDVHEYVTISIGGVLQMEHEGSSQEQLLAKADEALYKAKANGRKTFVFAPHQ